MYDYVFYKKFLRNQVYKLSPNSIIYSAYLQLLRHSFSCVYNLTKISEIQGINRPFFKHNSSFYFIKIIIIIKIMVHYKGKGKW
jgi:hypothetical protein